MTSQDYNELSACISDLLERIFFQPCVIILKISFLMKYNNFWSFNNIGKLTHFSPVSDFYTPWKRQKTKCWREVKLDTQRIYIKLLKYQPIDAFMINIFPSFTRGTQRWQSSIIYFLRNWILCYRFTLRKMCPYSEFSGP